MLTFEPIAHEYRWAGKVVPGVTSLLSTVVNWESVPTELMQAGRERGSAVHALCQALDEGVLEDWQVPLTLEPYMRAYRGFLAAYAPKWEGIEEQVYHPTYFYAGTLDRHGWLKSTRCVLDIKTGDSHPSYALQLSAYVEALGVGPRAHAKPERFVLRLGADGKFRLHEIKTKHNADFAVFLSLLNVARWKQKHGV